MPVEIRELQITVTVQEQGNSTAPAPAANEEQIINRCVEQVMEILKEKLER